LAVVNGQLYAIGGDNETTGLATIEVYDRDTNSWIIYESRVNNDDRFGAVGVIQQSIDDDESTQ